MTYPAVPVFWVQRTGKAARGARTYVGIKKGAQPCAGGRYHHSATHWVDIVEATLKLDLDDTKVMRDVEPLKAGKYPWPTSCEHCGHVFGDDAVRHTLTREIFQRHDGKLYVLPRNNEGTLPGGVDPMPPGAMYDAYWYPETWQGDDGISLCVILPNGSDWCVDSKANNCTRPKDKHKCWIRHGDPRLGDVTVDKNGDTCEAGAGSILAGDYHGFLREGTLTES